jgi:hypothetical protein
LRKALTILNELDPIPERVPSVAARSIGELKIWLDSHARLLEFFDSGFQVLHEKGRMGFGGWDKPILNADVDDGSASPKPTAASRCQRFRFLDLRQAEYSSVEPTRLRFIPGRHGQQDVVNASHFHKLVLSHLPLRRSARSEP